MATYAQDKTAVQEFGFAAKVRLAGLMLDYLNVKHRDLRTSVPDIVYKMSKGAIATRADQETGHFTKRTARMATHEPFNLAVCFHYAVLNLQVAHTGKPIDHTRMFTMVQHCYNSGAIGRSQEWMTVAERAELYAALAVDNA